MPKFRFAAVDTEGMLHDGNIDAPDAPTARARLEGNGLRVRELEEVDPPPGEPPLFEGPAPVRVARGDTRAEPGPPARGAVPPARASKWTYFFAVAGLLLALFSVAYTLYRNPPWGRLSRYDFSTPETALRSQLRMEADGDYKAQFEYQAKLMSTDLKTVSDSLVIQRTAPFDNKTVVFIQFRFTNPLTQQERERKIVEWFEKDEKTGYWMQARERPRDLPQKDPQLAAEIEAWLRSEKN
jgi:hypothetical protein